MQLLQADNYAKFYQDILDLRREFNLPHSKHEPLTPEELETHSRIFRSELKELALANNSIKCLDGLVDCVVTLMQRLVHLGYRGFDFAQKYETGVCFFINEMMVTAKDLGFNFDGGWDEIHASNMSKICRSAEDLAKTQEYYGGLGVETYAEETPSGGFVVKVAKDALVKGEDFPKDKFLKSVSMKKPDLKPFV